MALFRDHLLEGHRVALGGGAVELVSPLRRLGADVAEIPAGVLLDEDAARAWVDADSPIHALVHDAGPAFRTLGLQPALEQAWIATRAVATGALIPSGAGGKLMRGSFVFAGAGTSAAAASEPRRASRPSCG